MVCWLFSLSKCVGFWRSILHLLRLLSCDFFVFIDIKRYIYWSLSPLISLLSWLRLSLHAPPHQNLAVYLKKIFQIKRKYQHPTAFREHSLCGRCWTWHQEDRIDKTSPCFLDTGFSICCGDQQIVHFSGMCWKHMITDFTPIYWKWRCAATEARDELARGNVRRIYTSLTPKSHQWTTCFSFALLFPLTFVLKIGNSSTWE